METRKSVLLYVGIDPEGSLTQVVTVLPSSFGLRQFLSFALVFEALCFEVSSFSSNMSAVRM